MGNEIKIKAGTAITIPIHHAPTHCGSDGVRGILKEKSQGCG